MIYKAQSPMRIDLVGGTLDCWPIYSLLGGSSYVFNLAIDMKTSAELEILDSGLVEVVLEAESFEFSSFQEFSEKKHPYLSLLQQVISFYDFKKSFKIKFSSDSPKGAGLGASSSLCITFIKLFEQIAPKNLSDAQLIQVAANIECEILAAPTGTQDYIPALKGKGLYEITYDQLGFSFNTLDFDLDYFEENFCLIYTGAPHHSGLSNWEMLKGLVDKNSQTQKAFSQLQELSAQGRELIQVKDFKTLFDKEWSIRVQMAADYVTSDMELLRQQAAAFGGALKGLGAGGGGCVLAFVPGYKRDFLEAALKLNPAFKPLGLKAF